MEPIGSGDNSAKFDPRTENPEIMGYMRVTGPADKSDHRLSGMDNICLEYSIIVDRPGYFHAFRSCFAVCL